MIDELKKRGAGVDEVIVYRNANAILNEAAAELLCKKFDFIIFMSPSAVKNSKNFISKSNIPLNYSVIIAIGPETGKAARNEFQNVITADIHTIDGIIKKMLQYDLSPAKTTR
jgi:uroporphyrinogen-III synthase